MAFTLPRLTIHYIQPITHLSFGVIKKAYLLKVLYFFWVLPNKIPSSFFHDQQQQILQFIWQYHRSRVAKRTLFHGRTQVERNIIKLTFLTKYHATAEMPIWLCLEEVDCDPLHTDNLPRLLSKDTSFMQKSSLILRNLMLSNTFKPLTHLNLSSLHWLLMAKGQTKLNLNSKTQFFCYIKIDRPKEKTLCHFHNPPGGMTLTPFEHRC